MGLAFEAAEGACDAEDSGTEEEKVGGFGRGGDGEVAE